MRHGRIRDPLEGMKVVNQQTEEANRAFTEGGACGGALQVKVQAIELLPHLARYLLANGAGIFAGQRHRR